jgi:hypothetical protein
MLSSLLLLLPPPLTAGRHEVSREIALHDPRTRKQPSRLCIPVDCRDTGINERILDISMA